MSRDPVVTVSNLSVAFRTDQGTARAVNDVSLSVEKHRVLAVIGESGSGKSVMLKTILGITRDPRAQIDGQIYFDGRELVTLGERDFLQIRGNDVAMVFQDAMTALDPVFTVGHQLMETMRRHLHISRDAARERAVELLTQVNISSPEARLDSYPHQLSGGMRQRVMIAMAISCRPKLLLADEPTTALDVTVQAQIIRLILGLQAQGGMAMIFVTHDIGVAANVADDIAVMYGGRVVEQGPVHEVLRTPRHPYTQGLIDSNVTPGNRARLRTIPGQPPSPSRLPPGCDFSDRCPRMTPACRDEVPALDVFAAHDHLARCIHPLQVEPVPDLQPARS